MCFGPYVSAMHVDNSGMKQHYSGELPVNKSMLSPIVLKKLIRLLFIVLHVVASMRWFVSLDKSTTATQLFITISLTWLCPKVSTVTFKDCKSFV